MIKKLFRLLATVCLIIASPAYAQQAKKSYRIGYLASGTAAGDSARVAAIRSALCDLGYVEGQNITFEYQYTEGKRDRYLALAAEMVRHKVDIIVTGGDDLIRATMNATKTIPIVMIGPGSDPVEARFVKSLAHPGGNVTGVTVFNRELGGKRLELLKEAVPQLIRVAVLYQSATPGIARELKEDLPVAGRALGLTVRPWAIQDADGLEKAFSGLNKERSDGIYVSFAGGLLGLHAQRIANFALKGRLPSMYDSPSGVDAGGLMYYGGDRSESYRRVAYYIDRILKGTQPADLPVERSMKFEFIINLKTANQINLTVPQWTLMKADRVIRD